MIDDGWGAGISTDFISKEAEKQFLDIVKKYFEEYPSEFPYPDIFLEEVLRLYQLEKQYKHLAKKGFPIMVEMRFRKRDDYLTKERPPILLGVIDEEILQKNIEKEKPVEHMVYRSLDDFVVE